MKYNCPRRSWLSVESLESRHLLASDIIHGSLFVDANGNIQRESSELPFAGATVFIDLDQDLQLDAGEISTITAEDGTYQFTESPLGEQLIALKIPSGFHATDTPYMSAVVGTDGELSLPAFKIQTNTNFQAAILGLPDRPLQEGDYYTLKAAIYDPPPGLQLLYSWTVRRGDQVLIWQELSTEIAYPTYLEGEHTVELTVTALFYGPVAKATGTFTVENVAPRNLVVSGPTTGVPGMHMLFAGGHEDPGDASEHETVESWKLYRNGVLQEELTQPYFSNMPSQPGDYRLRYLVTDDQGVQTAVDHSFVVTTSLKRENELFIGGTTGADVIRVEPANSPAGAVRVLLGSENVGVYSNVTKLTAFAMEGNDLVTIDSRVRVASEIYGGGGNDQLIGGSGPDLLIGGPGNDKLHGRNGHDLLQGQAGQDLLYGGAGRDLLFGGTEVDRLFGGTGEDLLFGRATRFDTNFNALFSIQSRWIANLDFNARVATLNGSQSGRHMLTTFATVLHDKAQDYLAGNEDRDW